MTAVVEQNRRYAAVVGVDATPVWCAPDRVGDDDRELTREPPDLEAWVDGVSRGAVASLVGRLDTMAIMGEDVLVLTDYGEFAQVALPEQPTPAGPYWGWVRTRHLVRAGAPPAADAVAIVGRNMAVHDRPDGAPVGRMLFGSRVAVVDQRDGGWSEVRVPLGGTGWIPSDALARRRPETGKSFGEVLVGDAERFLGAPYVWGGACGLAVDCAGLVHLVARRHFLRVPRDADDQLAAGEEIDPTTAARGDLLFFGDDRSRIDHVGFCAGEGAMLHAPEPGRAVCVEPLSERARSRLCAARRLAAPL